METIKLTEKEALALRFLQVQEEPVPGSIIAENTGLNPKGISGVMNSLFKKQLVAKGDNVTMSVADAKGNMVERSYVTYFVTEDGQSFVEQAE